MWWTQMKDTRASINPATVCSQGTANPPFEQVGILPGESALLKLFRSTESFALSFYRFFTFRSFQLQSGAVASFSVTNYSWRIFPKHALVHRKALHAKRSETVQTARCLTGFRRPFFDRMLWSVTFYYTVRTGTKVWWPNSTMYTLSTTSNRWNVLFGMHLPYHSVSFLLLF